MTLAMNPAVARFRTVAYWEGISYLVLLLIAMPLKYGLDLPLAVRIVGALHGGLFLAYVALLLLAARALGARMTAVAAIASLIPGATFWLDKRLQRAGSS